MAYVIGKKVVKDTEDFNAYAYGLKLPIQRGPTGYFEQNFTSYEQAKSNLLNLLQTQQGERVMQPLYGTGLQTLLFEQIEDGVFEVKLEQVITQSVNYWLPYIKIQSIEIELTDQLKDENKANIKIQFTVGNEIDLQEITFTVSG